MDPMRGMTPEEAAGYKEFKGKIFTRVACHFCPEKDAEIARLTEDLAAAETTRIRLLTEGSAERRNCEYKFLALQAATRKVVEALDESLSRLDASRMSTRNSTGDSAITVKNDRARAQGRAALADPIIRDLG